MAQTNIAWMIWFSSDGSKDEEPETRPIPPPRGGRNGGSAYSAPIPTPPPDDMEPQSVCFVQDDAGSSSNEANSMSSKKSSLQQITSGSKTYRITPEGGSPPRLTAHRLFNKENNNGKSKGFDIPVNSCTFL